MTELVYPTDKNAHYIIESNTALAAIAGALPYPFISGMAVKSVQLKMIYQLSLEYRQPFSENLARSVLLIIVAGLIASMVIKVFNLLMPRTSVWGLASNLTTLALGAGAETYVVGYIIKQHFDTGGNLRNFSLKKSRGNLAKLYEEGKLSVKKLANGKNKPAEEQSNPDSKKETG